MKRLISVTMAGALLVALCTGCGTVTKKETATEGAIEVQSGDATKKENSTALAELAERQGVFLTENSMFIADDAADAEERYDDYLVQYDLRGNKIKKFNLKGELIGVGNGYICYCKCGEKADILYTAPIEKTAKGESINMKKEEKIAERSGGREAYVWESYVVYLDDNLYCYNYETKQTKKIGKENEFKYRDVEFVTGDDAGDVLYVQDGKLYMRVYDDKRERTMFYSAAIETGAVEELFSYQEDIEDIGYYFFAADNNLLFFDRDSEKEDTSYICYDIENNQKTKIKSQDIISLLRRQNMWTENSEYNIMDCFDYRDRLYLVAYVSLPEKILADCGPSKGETIEVNKGHMILVSCPWTDITNLRYEKASEWIVKNQSWELQWVDMSHVKGGGGSSNSHYSMSTRLSIWEHCGDELLITESTQTGKSDNESLNFIGIQLETGEVRSIPKDSTLYRVLKV
ncbi:MAG: hypothetical protein J1E62_11460 [Lachnospiraceae bacterium]|nr:hypothetical protein [Lachnospiraceae bacterium]